MIKLCKYYKIVFEQIKPSLAKGCLAGQEGFGDDFGYLFMEGVLSARIQSENTELWCLKETGKGSGNHLCAAHTIAGDRSRAGSKCVSTT